MPSLLDNIDRFTYTAQKIQSASISIRSNTKSGLFSRAVLQLPLGDRARDIDASELGLFTLVSQPAATAAQTGVGSGNGDNDDSVPPALGEVVRKSVPEATPLRRPVGGRGGIGTKGKEKPPEVYAEAALKYLDRYDSIRPMPRARQEVNAIIERLNALRSGIDSMNAVVEHKAPEGTSHNSIKEEEKRIQQLQSRIKQLKARKDVLAQKRPATKSSPSTALDSQEEEFWGATESKPRHSLVLQGNDESLLMDAEIDMGNVSVTTFSEMPTPVPTQSKSAPSSSRPAPSWEPRSHQPTYTTRLSEGRPALDLPPGADISFNSEAEDSILDDSMAEEGDTTIDEDAENTVMLSKAPQASEVGLPQSETRASRSATPPGVGSTERTTPTSTPADVRAATPTQKTPRQEVTTPAALRKSKYRITNDTERIVAKIWSTVGDLIMPGHPFNTAAAASTNKPPKAKDTIALLENVASKSPPQSSPARSLSSFSLTAPDPPSASNPNAQQILTAHLLYTLLTTTETYSMPLNKAKEALSAKGLGGPPPGTGASTLALGIVGTSGQAVETRALYGCIAKRLLKIDRSGREQVLKFDV